MRRFAFVAALAAFALPTAPAFALDVLLDFSGPICGAAGTSACGDYSEIGQNYGDVAGVLDVSHRSALAGSGVTVEPFLKYWSTGYSNLTGVAWGGSWPSGQYSEFTFTPAAGQQVTLNGFEFGDYANQSYTSSATILDAQTLQVLWTSGTFDPGSTSLSFAPAITSANGLILRWGPDGYDTGIDNISLSVTAVPEPAVWALMLGGAALMAARARRRCA